MQNFAGTGELIECITSGGDHLMIGASADEQIPPRSNTYESLCVLKCYSTKNCAELEAPILPSTDIVGTEIFRK